MPVLDKALIVTVLVPTKALDRASNGAWDGAVGTGCAVSNGLILTSRHVVDRENRNPKYPIKVRWYALREKNDPRSGWVDLDSDDNKAIAWMGTDDLDAALLVCARPDHEKLRDIPAYRIASARPTGLLEWESRGFPQASVVGGESGHGDFHGRIESMASVGDTFFTVTSALKAGPEASDWSGASGMPIMVGDTLFGVVKDVPANYENKKLRVVPAFRLREREAFLGKFGADALKHLPERVRDLMIRALEGKEAAVRALSKHLKVDYVGLDHCCNALAEVALETPLSKLIKAALVAKEELLRADDIGGVEVVTEFALAVLPAGADPNQVETIGAVGAGPVADLIRLDVHSPTVAEIAMAAADGRKACFRMLQREKDTAVGEGALGLVPEGGRDPNDTQRLRDVTTELIQLFEASFAEGLDRALFEHLRYAIIQDDLQTPGAGVSEKEREAFERDLCDAINEALDAQSEMRALDGGRFTYYLIVETPPSLSDTEKKQRDLVLDRINRQFSGIAVLCTSPRPANPLREMKPFMLLNKLLYRKPRTP